MGSLKRKDVPGANAPTAKPAQHADEARPSKRPKSSKTDAKTKSTTDRASKAMSASATVSTLKEEEPLFPRGGASVLTPLEQKQIQVQAKKDALFEQESGPPTGKADKTSKKKKRTPESKLDRSSLKLARDEDAVKIESLNYKVWTSPEHTVNQATNMGCSAFPKECSFWVRLPQYTPSSS